MWQKQSWCDLNMQKAPKKLWQLRLPCDILKMLRCDKLWLAIKHESIPHHLLSDWNNRHVTSQHGSGETASYPIEPWNSCRGEPASRARSQASRHPLVQPAAPGWLLHCCWQQSPDLWDWRLRDFASVDQSTNQGHTWCVQRQGSAGRWTYAGQSALSKHSTTAQTCSCKHMKYIIMIVYK